MKKEQLAFLIGGFAFGILVGYGLFHAVYVTPDLQATAAAPAAVPSPQGPMAATQTGTGSGGAPMMARINGLKAALQENPEDARILIELADLYHQAAMCNVAIGYYERAVAIDATDPDILTNLGVCYQAERDFERALDLFSRAHEADPAHWRALFNTVIVAIVDLQRADLANEAMARIDEIDPTPPDLDPAQLQRLRDEVRKFNDLTAGEQGRS